MPCAVIKPLNLNVATAIIIRNRKVGGIKWRPGPENKSRYYAQCWCNGRVGIRWQALKTICTFVSSYRKRDLPHQQTPPLIHRLGVEHTERWLRGPNVPWLTSWQSHNCLICKGTMSKQRSRIAMSSLKSTDPAQHNCQHEINPRITKRFTWRFYQK